MTQGTTVINGEIADIQGDTIKIKDEKGLNNKEKVKMPYINVGKENSGDIEIYYKDWRSGRPIVFHQGWP